MSLTLAGCSHQNRHQDSLGWHRSSDGHRALTIVADGLGGDEGGEIASRIAVDTLLAVLRPAVERGVADDAIADRIQAVLNLANERIGHARRDRPEFDPMGTSVVVAWLQRGRAWVGHIGDARCYRMRGDQLQLQTRDDTVAQHLVDDGSITEDEHRQLPFRKVLSRALGVSRDAGASFTELTLAPGERLILCPEGLVAALPVQRWPELLAESASLEAQSQQLLSAGLANAASDRVSVMMVRYGE